jgi:hypothetical protein
MLIVAFVELIRCRGAGSVPLGMRRTRPEYPASGPSDRWVDVLLRQEPDEEEDEEEDEGNDEDNADDDQGDDGYSE